MRFRQFSENSAMDDTVEIMKKSFSPERKAVQAEVLELVRAVQMGKGDKMELAMKITALAKSELEAKRSDPDLKISVDQNMGMLDRAMKAVTGMSEGITEDEIEEYKSLASLRNRSSLDAMARLQDRNKPKEPKVIEIPKGTQLDLFKKASEDIEEGAREIDPKKMQAYMDFKKEKDIDGSSVRMAVDNPDHPETKRMMTNDDFAKAVDMYKSAVKESVEEEQFDEKVDDMPPEGPEATVGDYTSTHLFMCGSAIETVNKHGDKPGMEKLVRMLDMIYKIEQAVMDGEEATDEVKELSKNIHMEIMNTAKEIGIEDEVAEYQEMHLDSITKGDPKPGFGRVDESVSESLTEEQFDEKAGEKDACYRKVKSRYKVWPSAYASGALVKCRKVGAANWGNSKKK